MNNIRSRGNARLWIGTAMIVLLFGSAAIQGQDDKDRKKGASGSAPAKHENPSAPPANRQGSAGGGQGQPTHQNAGQQAHQDTAQPARPSTGGGPGGHQNASQPAPQSAVPPARETQGGQFNRQNAGQAAPQNTAQPARETQGGQYNRPNAGQAAPQNTAQPSRETPGQFNRQNAGQNAPQNTGQPNRDTQGRQFGRQDAGQPPPQSGGQPNRETQGRQFGRQDAGQPARPDPFRGGRPEVGQSPSQRQPGPPAGGRQFGQSQVTRYPDGRPQTIRTPNGGMVNRDRGGQVREVHTPGGAVITHRPDGMRRVEIVRPGNRIIVTSEHGHGGYAQRPLIVHDREYIQRTYFVHGVSYARVYRPVTYRGVVFNLYTPVRYYRPAFYSYAYSPWGRPVIYNWGWAGRPWYGYYGGYFSPYPQYVSPAFWLTDFLIASTLEAAYQERMDANLQGGGYAPGGQVGLTPDVKEAIADEVRRQLDLERAEGQSMSANTASGQMPPMFADNLPHVFVVSGSLIVDSRGQECAITDGDVIRLIPGSSNGSTADTIVLASKGQDCRRGNVVSVQFQDLQEMENHMRATIDQGLADLQSGQGKGGLPPLPPAAAAAPVDAPFAAEVRPDANVATELNQAAQEASTAEQSVVNQSADDTGNSAGPVTISLGQSMADVESINGKPDKVVDLGAKKIYVYKDMKITFTDGRVSDVQ